MNYDIIVIVGILLLIGVGVGAYYLTKGSGYIDDGRHGPLGHPATPFVRMQQEVGYLGPGGPYCQMCYDGNGQPCNCGPCTDPGTMNCGSCKYLFQCS